MAKKGFVISWFYPPGNSSEGLVTYKLLKNSKYNYDVFTRETSEHDIWDRDVSEDKLTSKNVNIIKSQAQNHDAWVKEAVDYFLAHKDEYDFIMSRIMPAEAHIAASIIKKKCPQVKWLASFGDPLVRTPYLIDIDPKDNPYYFTYIVKNESLPIIRWPKLAISPTRAINKLAWEKRRKTDMVDTTRYAKINNDVFEQADILIFNNKQQYNHAFIGDMAKYRPKGVIINHSYDLELYPKVKKTEHKKIKFAYVGHLDKLRNPRAILKAINLLKEHDSKLSNKVEFNFYGHMGEWDKVYLVDHQLTDIVHVNGNVEYFDSLRIIEDSDWTLLIDANFNDRMDEYLFFPAKLVDYLGAKKNIFAVSQLKGATADVLHQTGGAQICTHSADEIALYLAKIIYEDYKPEPFNTKACDAYNAETVAKLYDKIVKELVND